MPANFLPYDWRKKKKTCVSVLKFFSIESAFEPNLFLNICWKLLGGLVLISKFVPIFLDILLEVGVPSIVRECRVVTTDLVMAV